MMISRTTKKFLNRKALLTAISIVIIINIYNFEMIEKPYVSRNNEMFNFSHSNWRNLSQQQVQEFSNLGRILFLDEKPPSVDNSILYKILIWKHGHALAQRHIRNESNPFQYCSVQNCVLSYNDSDLKTADLVVFHLHRIQSVKELPVRTIGNKQIWTFLTDESPHNTFLHKYLNDVKTYNNIFNWSMSYGMFSDIPVPYGRTIVRKHKVDKVNIRKWNQNKKQDVVIAVLISNCNEKRLAYIKELNKHILVDIYGRCGKLKCPGHFHSDCQKISNYKFYLSFENSNCNEYITEKVWWNGYHKNTIPVIMGGSKLSLQQHLPPNSYIDVNDFASPRYLAKYIMKLNSSLGEMERFFEWKRHFKVLNEHGYFQSLSVHYCRVCEALNYNSKRPKIYKNLNEFINLNKCR